MSNEVEEIKHRIDIVDFISGYLTLKKAGVNYKGLCPFHQEKTGSFMVSHEKQIFKCFGCNEGGDVFEFVMKMENLDFREALEMLAARTGVELVKKDPTQIKLEQERTGRKTRLFEINNLSKQFFHKILLDHPTGKIALDYLINRGLTLETIKTFEIGYAPSPQSLREWLLRKGYKPDELHQAGSPDRFYKRIMFPICDVMGNTLGFTGRVIDKEMEPKYLNTPETDIFHKGRILYNLDRAKSEIKLKQFTLIVEGQMDVIASYQAGVKNVVASSGTALTNDHLQTLFRYTPNLVFCFDSDTAGLTTSKKAYEMAIEQGLNAKMITIEGYKDPGELIAKTPELWPEVVEKAKPVIDWYFQLAFGKQQTTNGQNEVVLTPVQKKEIAKEIIPVIKKIPDSIEQAHYVNLLAQKLGIKDEIIFDILKKPVMNQEKKSSKNEVREPVKQLTLEEILIGILYLKPSKFLLAQNQIKLEDLTSDFSQQIYTELKKCYTKTTKEIKVYFSSALSSDDLKRIELIAFEVDKTYLTEDNVEQVINDICHKILQEKKEILKNKYALAIKVAEESGDLVKLKEIVKEFQDAISR